MKNLTDKPWYRSKKYLAFLTMEIMLAGLASLALWRQPDLGWPLAAFMLAIVLTMGAVAFGFNLTQASADRYLRGMAISMSSSSGPVIDPVKDLRAQAIGVCMGLHSPDVEYDDKGEPDDPK